MTNTDLIRAMGGIDPRLIAEAAPDVRQKKPVRKAWMKWASLAAACLALVIGAFPIMDFILGGSYSDVPVSHNYNSLEEVHNALGFDTLYSKLDLGQTNTRKISLSCASINGDNGLQANLEKPLQLQIRATYPNGEATDRVDYYIIFNRDSVDDSYVGGYEEQGLTKEINGITVHYSLIQDGAMHGQAKFLHEGNLYVIDVNSGGNEYNLDTYMNMVLDHDNADNDAFPNNGGETDQSSAIPQDFAIRFSSRYVAEEIYDTYTGTIQKDLIANGTAMAAFVPSQETLEAIYGAVMEYQICSIDRKLTNDVLADKDGPQFNMNPNRSYEITITADGRTYTIRGDDTAQGFTATDQDARYFVSFIGFMKSVLYETPEYKKLPDAVGSYE